MYMYISLKSIFASLRFAFVNSGSRSVRTGRENDEKKFKSSYWQQEVRRWGGLRRQFWKYYVGFVQPLLGPDVGRVAATGILQVLTESCTPAILPP